MFRRSDCFPDSGRPAHPWGSRRTARSSPSTARGPFPARDRTRTADRSPGTARCSSLARRPSGTRCPTLHPTHRSRRRRTRTHSGSSAEWCCRHRCCRIRTGPRSARRCLPSDSRRRPRRRAARRRPGPRTDRCRPGLAPGRFLVAPAGPRPSTTAPAPARRTTPSPVGGGYHFASFRVRSSFRPPGIGRPFRKARCPGYRAFSRELAVRRAAADPRSGCADHTATIESLFAAPAEQLVAQPHQRVVLAGRPPVPSSG